MKQSLITNDTFHQSQLSELDDPSLGLQNSDSKQNNNKISFPDAAKIMFQNAAQTLEDIKKLNVSIESKILNTSRLLNKKEFNFQWRQNIRDCQQNVQSLARWIQKIEKFKSENPRCKIENKLDSLKHVYNKEMNRFLESMKSISVNNIVYWKKSSICNNNNNNNNVNHQHQNQQNQNFSKASILMHNKSSILSMNTNNDQSNYSVIKFTEESAENEEQTQKMANLKEESFLAEVLKERQDNINEVEVLVRNLQKIMQQTADWVIKDDVVIDQIVEHVNDNHEHAQKAFKDIIYSKQHKETKDNSLNSQLSQEDNGNASAQYKDIQTQSELKQSPQKGQSFCAKMCQCFVSQKAINNGNDNNSS